MHLIRDVRVVGGFLAVDDGNRGKRLCVQEYRLHEKRAACEARLRSAEELLAKQRARTTEGRPLRFSMRSNLRHRDALLLQMGRIDFALMQIEEQLAELRAQFAEDEAFAKYEELRCGGITMEVAPEHAEREPFVHVVKRQGMTVTKSLLVRAGAVVAALLLCSLLSILLIKENPLEFVKTLFEGNFSSPRRRWKFAKDLSVLLCISLAVTPAFRMRFWNIGAEGQTLMGALAAVAVAYYLGDALPNPVLLLLMLIAALVAGAVWGIIPALFKAGWNTNETLFTLMMNYVASGLVAYFLLLWTPDGSSVLGELSVGHLPVIGHEYLLLVLAVLALTVVVFVYLNYTKHGYEVSVVGESENTARYVGIRVGKVIIRTMTVSGLICGFAGFLIVGALDHSVTVTSVGGMGFTAIMVSWLAKFNPLIMIGTSALITFLQQGASQVSTSFNIDSSFPSMMVGIVLFFIIGCEFFIQYRLVFRKTEKVRKGGADE